MTQRGIHARTLRFCPAPVQDRREPGGKAGRREVGGRRTSTGCHPVIIEGGPPGDYNGEHMKIIIGHGNMDLDCIASMALARYLYNEQNFEGALKELEDALALDPSFWEARKFMGEILLEKQKEGEALTAYKDLISHLNVAYLKFQCSNCGFKPDDLQWQCPQCRKWDTMSFMDSKMGESALSPQLQEPPINAAQEKTEEEA